MNTNLHLSTGRLRWALVATIGVLVALALFALSGATGPGRAHADATTIDEVAFVTALDEKGIPYSSEDAVIAYGHSNCRAFAAGATVWQVIRAGKKGADGFWTTNQVAYIAGASVAAFCPLLDPAYS